MIKTISIFFKTLVFLLIFINTTSANTSNNSKKRIQFNVTIAAPEIHNDGYYYGNNRLYNALLDNNYNIADCFAIGLYGGIGQYREFICIEGLDSRGYVTKRYSSTSKHPYSFHYGLSTKFHILPLAFSKSPEWIDLFLTGKIGGVNMNSSGQENIIPEKGNFFDVTLGAGGNFYFSKHVGISAELGYKRFYFYNGFTARYGISVRF